MNNLLPCPFCGGEAAVCDIKEPSVNGWVGCQRCRCFINWVKNGKSLAIAAWNRRADGKDTNVPTNAQRIRGMSDEELQKFLHEFESGDIDYAKTFCDLCCKDAALERRSVDCEGCLLWWLKNDAKQPQGLDCWTKQPAETEGKE